MVNHDHKSTTWSTIAATIFCMPMPVQFYARGLFASPMITGYNQATNGPLGAVVNALWVARAGLLSVIDYPLRRITGGVCCCVLQVDHQAVPPSTVCDRPRSGCPTPTTVLQGDAMPRRGRCQVRRLHTIRSWLLGCGKFLQTLWGCPETRGGELKSRKKAAICLV